MKAKFLGSFRFKIISYTVLSIVCTVLTLSVINFFVERINCDAHSALLHICGWIILSAIIFVSYFTAFSYRMIGYLREIANGIARISSGDFDTNIRVRDEDELSTIAYSVNKMRCRISLGIEKEREIEKNKNELITNVAHDLKTPLTSIVGYLELLRYQKELTPALQEKYIAVAAQKAKRLQLLMEELFDYTRYDRNKMKLKLAPIELCIFTEQLMEEFYPEMKKHSIECICDFPVAEIWTSGDGELLARAFGNVISNAIKYGRKGKIIKISMEVRERDVDICITNFGEIIPEPQIGEIFNQFYRLESSRSENTGGTGLGLAIAKKIVDMHNGKINAKSSIDGTVFTITLFIDTTMNAAKKELAEKEEK